MTAAGNNFCHAIGIPIRQTNTQSTRAIFLDTGLNTQQQKSSVELSVCVPHHSQDLFSC
jgi:hypothetical protein